jgi:hypothetical protein
MSQKTKPDSQTKRLWYIAAQESSFYDLLCGEGDLFSVHIEECFIVWKVDDQAFVNVATCSLWLGLNV